MNRRLLHYVLVLFVLLGVGFEAYAQGVIRGQITDKDNDMALVGARVVLKDTYKGAITDGEGYFTLKVDPGTYTLEITYIGYTSAEQQVTVRDGETVELGTISMASDAIALDEVNILASVAVDRQTPVAVSSISTDQIETKLGTQEFPEILKSTPSIYTTKQGGGWGDARINVRGFDQRNTAVLINGIPVNDMENGWVYWSNWAGLSDVTRTIQVQRGLGASKLAINSVGGTINLITKTTDMKAGGSAQFTVGNDGYFKASFTASTGRLEGGWAFTVSGSRTVGNGYIDAAYIDGYSYFASISKELGENHQLVFTAIGAPQKHGQRSFAERLKTYVPFEGAAFYDELIKKSKTADFDERIDGPGDVGKYSPWGNVRYNSDWGIRDGEIFNIRENFYHKPQLALNHYWSINSNTTLATSFYYSIGRGGGTGDRGRISGRGTWGFRDGNGIIRVDDIVAWNRGGNGISGFPEVGALKHEQYGYVAGERLGLIKRASMNEHNWMGVLSTLNTKLTDKLNLIVGADIRYYKGLHYRKAVDLLGADYWLDPRDVNNKSTEVDIDGNGSISSWEQGRLIKADDKLWGNPGQENKVNYDNDGIVNWQGGFAQLEYVGDDGFSAFIAGSGSNTSYKRVDRFAYTPGNQESQTLSFPGFNTKAGFNYNLDSKNNFFVNGGYYSRAPIFDVAFPNFVNDGNPNAENEKVLAVEAGYGVRAGRFAANINIYNTLWKDRNLFRRFFDSQGNQYQANLTGLDALHKGIEIDFNAKPIEGLTVTGMFSLGDWRWKNNIQAEISDDNDVVIGTVNVFADGLKVGDAAQTTAALGFDYQFKFGLRVFADYTYYNNLYARFDPTSRTEDPNAAPRFNNNATKLPDYGLVDAGISYTVDFTDKLGMRVYGNVYNLFDELYVAEATDRQGESLENLNGFFGFGRTWSAGVKIFFW
ncbi:MAG: TonB-dependent receptor [Bacteroidetes bacterium]|nr:MAG: TonB-dependent receptor [Bacteroidota bacterium]